MTILIRASRVRSRSHVCAHEEVESFIWSRDLIKRLQLDSCWPSRNSNYRLVQVESVFFFFMLKSVRLHRPQVEGIFAMASWRGFIHSKFLQTYYYLWLYFNLPLCDLRFWPPRGWYPQKNWVVVCGPKLIYDRHNLRYSILYPIYDLTKNSKPYLWPEP